MTQVKHALITGAAGGLGHHLVRVFAHAGYHVYACDLVLGGNPCPEIPGGEFHPLDVRSPESVAAVAERVTLEAGSLDVLVNAAAILPANSARILEEFDIEDSLRVFDVNALGALRMTKAFLPLLEKGEDKMIVNLSSEAGSMTTHANYTIRYDYCMSKAALNIQTIILQRYLKPRGIKLLAVHPGWMRTSMGGEKAPVEPADSAAGILALAQKYKGRTDDLIYVDYDGTPRAW
ncbi:MAG TPA: SDR family NAD(P)-dependent oxidoreductase [Clostridia bacterium]